jgi:hypothetical protein
MKNVMNYLLWILLYSFYWNLEPTYWQQTIQSQKERAKVDTEQKSSKFVILNLCIPCILQVFTVYNQQMHLVFDI